MGAERYIKVYTDLRGAERDFSMDASQLFTPYQHFIPQLPEWTNKEYRSKEETVNLFNLTCTCSEYRSLSTQYQSRDIRCACRHIFNKIKSSKAHEHIDFLTYSLLESSAIHGEKYLIKGVIDKHGVIVGTKNECSWLNIYTQYPVYYNIGKSPDTYFKYSFSLEQNRWSYKWSPYNGERLIKIIKDALHI